jgi:hypothetical protein
VPNPLSWWLHAQPRAVHVAGAAFNHAVELGAPLLLLAGRTGRRVAGLLFIIFQVTLILSGNLSFLNWLTIVPALACLDDGVLEYVVPRGRRTALESRLSGVTPSRLHRAAAIALAVLVIVLSVVRSGTSCRRTRPRTARTTHSTGEHLRRLSDRSAASATR